MRSVALHEVSKFYGSVPVVNGVSLRVADGEFVTLLGPSGCGKTTTLRLIAGLAVPDLGRIEVGGSDVTHTPIHRRNIGMVFQSHALFPHMTIAENVGFGLKMRGVGRAERTGRIREALKLVRLDNFESRFPGQLSGGQQQRIALARALVFNPQVLLLDEPFGALDRKLREVMQGELRELTRKLEMTSIFVTHDQEEALILSDRIAVMHAGEIEQIGSPEDIFERPRTRFVADFMGFGNLLEGVVMSAAGDGATVKVGRMGISFSAGVRLVPGAARGLGNPRRAHSDQATHFDGDRQPSWRDRRSVVSGRGTCVLSSALIGFRGLRLAVRDGIQGGSDFRLPVGSRVQVDWHPGSVQILRI